MVHWVKHFPLDPNSPIVEEVQQINHILSSDRNDRIFLKKRSAINSLFEEQQVSDKERQSNQIEATIVNTVET
jgi:hypothetical protein